MVNDIHGNFIRTPIIEILKDTIFSCSLIGIGIETQPLSDYILQSTFLKMTGASEQKFKCIYWTMGTYDYAYRYKMKDKGYTEFSSYKDKNGIFKDLLDLILEISNTKSNLFEKKEDKEVFITEIKKVIKSLLDNSILTIWNKFEYIQYNKTVDTTIKSEDFCIKSKGNNILLSEKVSKIYTDIVYRHRNRCAHNLKSYQSNLPMLKNISNYDYMEENYFIMFFILILIDEIFIKLYNLYIEKLSTSMV